MVGAELVLLFSLNQDITPRFCSGIDLSHRSTEELGVGSVWATLKRVAATHRRQGECPLPGFSAHTPELRYVVCTNVTAGPDSQGTKRAVEFLL
jgi:hypothetical protein